MNKILAAAIIGLSILVCFLKLENAKLENQVLQCKSEIKDLENKALTINNKSLGENVKIKIVQQNIKRNISDIQFDNWVRVFAETRADHSSKK